MHKILVITATLGTRETLKRTIESVRIIGKNDVKHIIVAPENRISLIKAKYGDIDCLPELKNSTGIYVALNHGFCTFGNDYEYLTFINDDDYWLPDFRILIDTILNNEKTDFVYGRTKYVDAENDICGIQTSSSQFYSFIPLLKQHIILLTQQATIIKSNLYFEVGGFDENYKLIADTKFWAKLSLLKPHFKYLNKECAAYMIQDGQLSSDHITQQKEYKRLMDEFVTIRTNNMIVLRFRLSNLLIYIKRKYIFKSLKNPLSSTIK